MAKILSLPGKHQLFIFSGSMPAPEYREAYLQAYACWKQVWEKVYYQEMKLHHPLYSDDFIRQDLIVALFTEGQCVGTAFMRFCDLTLQPWQEDSYFRYWPQQSIKEILVRCQRVSMASYFTVHPDFRQVRDPICWKELLLALFIDAFCEQEAEIMVTAARKLKSNEKLCQKLNARLLQENVPFTIDGKEVGELTDLVYWPKEKIALKNEFMQTLREEIWRKRIIVSPVSKGVSHAA